MSRNLQASLLALSCFSIAGSNSADCQTIEPEKALECVQAFRDLSQASLDRWSVAGFESEVITVPTTRKKNVKTPVRSLSDGPCVMTESAREVSGKKKTIVLLANSDYSATVSRFETQPWSMESLDLSSEPGYRLNISPTFVPLRKYSVPPFALLLARICSGSLLREKEENETTFFNAILGPAVEAEHPVPEFTEVSVEVARGTSSDELRAIRFRTSAVVGKSPISAYTQLEFSDWQKTIHGMLPGSITQRFEQLDVANPGTKLVEFTSAETYDYSRMENAVSTDECFLTYYGLPEPEDLPSSIPWFWLIIGGLAVAAGIWGIRISRST